MLVYNYIISDCILDFALIQTYIDLSISILSINKVSYLIIWLIIDLSFK